MAYSYRGRNEVWEKGQVSMRLEELRVEGKQLRMKDFLDSGEVDSRVFRPRMVAVDQQSSQSKECKQAEISKLQTRAPRMGSSLPPEGLFSK